MYLFGLLLSIFGLAVGSAFVAGIGAMMFICAICAPNYETGPAYRTPLKDD